MHMALILVIDCGSYSCRAGRQALLETELRRQGRGWQQSSWRWWRLAWTWQMQIQPRRWLGLERRVREVPRLTRFALNIRALRETRRSSITVFLDDEQPGAGTDLAIHAFPPDNRTADSSATAGAVVDPAFEARASLVTTALAHRTALANLGRLSESVPSIGPARPVSARVPGRLRLHRVMAGPGRTMPWQPMRAGSPASAAEGSSATIAHDAVGGLAADRAVEVSPLSTQKDGGTRRRGRGAALPRDISSQDGPASMRPGRHRRSRTSPSPQRATTGSRRRSGPFLGSADGRPAFGTVAARPM